LLLLELGKLLLQGWLLEDLGLLVGIDNSVVDEVVEALALVLGD
jgi:hypothetical protein